MSATTIDLEVRDYIAALERYLDDLPDGDRRELLEDLEQHIREVAAEGDGSLHDRLGSPATYADELRASAGLPARVDRSSLGATERAREALSRLSAVPGVRAVRNFLPDLKPGWWVLRGYLAAVAIDVLVFRPNPVGVIPWPAIDGNAAVGTLFVLACIVASVALGRAGSRDRRIGYLGASASIGVVLLALSAIGPLQMESMRMIRFETPSDLDPGFPGHLQHGDGSDIANICAYDKHGKRIKRVLLHDQNGRPITDVAPDRFSSEMFGSMEFPKQDLPSNEFPRRGVVVDPRTGEPHDFECPKEIDPGAVREHLRVFPARPLPIP